jgi:subtilisin family serine protease
MPIDIILELPALQAKSAKGSASEKQILQSLNNAGIPVTGISESKLLKPRKGKAAFAFGTRSVVANTSVQSTEINPWDVAHMAANAGRNSAVRFAEPDIEHQFVVAPKVQAPYQDVSAKSFGKPGAAGKVDPDWPPAQNTIWHLDDEYSQLKSARDAVANLNGTVRIAHLDTGYAAHHSIVPDAVKTNPLQRNFVEGEDASSAADPMLDGMLKMPGHGTGTLGLLAGGKVKLKTDNGLFNDYLGGAPFADVVCCRIAPTVVLMKTSAFAQALQYLVQLCYSGTPVHVVSMSMGGAPSKAWADAVNAAYDAGITLVTAAGNHFNGLPTKHLVYPARFGRVLAACGVTHDFKPYSTKLIGEMQGCYGPMPYMKKALAAFTPNTPWASASSGGISFGGAGTSSATPQIAAAAAIYYRQYYQPLQALQPWQRVEAIRNALYKSAKKYINLKEEDYRLYFGNGILQANAALQIPVADNLQATPPDKVPWFPILSTLFKGPKPESSAAMQMMNTELAQLVFHYPALGSLIDEGVKPMTKVSQKQWKGFADAVIGHPATSETLRTFLKASR